MVQESTSSSPGEGDPRPSGSTAATAGAAAASAPALSRGLARADDAGKVAETMLDISALSRTPTTRRELNDFLKSEAGKTRRSTGPNGKSGARGRLKGHLFEDLDIQAHNAVAKARGSELRKRENPQQQTYDADRFIDGQYAGSVQHKSSAAGADSAIGTMEKSKPGSAKTGTIRVPGDQVKETRHRIRGRARVQGSEVTTDRLESTLDSGLDELARRGVAGTSKVRAAARGAGKAAVMSAGMGAAMEAQALATGEISPRRYVANRARESGEAAVATSATSVLEKVGKTASGGRAIAHGAARSATVTVLVSSLRDIPAIARGDLSGRDFAENRAVDAAETATTVALGTTATGAVLASATGSASAAAVGAGAASAATAVAGTVGGMGSAGAAGASALGAVSAAAAGPAILGGAVMVGTGIAVGKVFKLVRHNVRQRQAARRRPAGPTEDTPRADQGAEFVEGELILRGRGVFSASELSSIRAHLERRVLLDGRERQAVTRELRQIDFYASDWAPPGQALTPEEFDALIAAGLITEVSAR